MTRRGPRPRILTGEQQQLLRHFVDCLRAVRGQAPLYGPDPQSAPVPIVYGWRLYDANGNRRVGRGFG